MGSIRNTLVSCCFLASVAGTAFAQVAITGDVVYTMTGDASNKITNGVVIITDGKIAAVGPAASTKIPDGYKVLHGAVVTPGLVDARGTEGVSGIFNQKQDQDQLEHSSPVQPELRAIDAYNPNDPLVEWVRNLGVTTVNTGNAPGELVSGQTGVFKTVGKTVDEAVVKDVSAVVVTLGPWSQKEGKESPGTRGKEVAMLRQQLIKAQEYADKLARKAKEGDKADKHEDDHADDAKGEKGDKGGRDLKLEAFAKVLAGEVPLMVTANRAQDIDSALRLAAEFKFKLILDSAAESYLLIDQIKAAGVPVILHPTMFRMFGEMENMSMETAGKLAKAGIPVAIESGYEAYVPKTRVVLFEAAVAAANGMTFEQALASITSQPAKILGVDNRVGSLKPGLDGDVALYDGDPFEYTSHCTGVVIQGVVVSENVR
ncbi:MAG: amidohydrolase family protein [Phycisphaerales bacterium]|jgi:imidazolonepropionase-like amidohydrolase